MVEGTGSSGVMLVAEASGEMEARDQLPLRPYAPSGSVLERVLRRMGLDRRMFSITNCVRCRPRQNWLEGAPWEFAALNHCRPNLDAAIAQFKPRLIVALGGIALRELTGEAGEARGIGHLAGYVLPLMGRRRIPEGSICGMCEHWEDKSGCTSCRGRGTLLVDRVVPEYADIPVIGNFHPSYLRRGKASHQGILARILQRAVNIAAGRDREWMWGVDPDDGDTYANLQYIVRPSLDTARSFAERVRSNQSLVVSYDLETGESASLDEDAREGFVDTQIRLIQFATEQGGGIAIPWEGDFRGIARQILQSSNVKCGHNIWLFDNKVLRAVSEREGVDYVPRGTLHDTLQMFHHWQPDLPAHLQFCAQFVQFPFPWKHLAGTDIEFYGCCDVDATLRLYNYLYAQLVKDGIWDDQSYIATSARGATTNGSIAIASASTVSNGHVDHAEVPITDKTRGYIGQVFEVRPILAAMEDRGVPIDDAARLRLGAEFDAEQKRVGQELQQFAPVECKRVHPKDGYKGEPPQVRQFRKDPASVTANWIQPDSLVPFAIENIRFQEPSTKNADGVEEEGEWYVYQQREFPSAVLTFEGEPTVMTTPRWCRLYDFNPNSSKQLIAYMKAKGHPVPKSKEEDDEGNQKDTTGKKELVRLAKKVNDKFYLKVIEYRELSKMRGTYIEGYKPQADGRVHTTFTFDTGIGQLSSRSPNIQNAPKHGPLAKAIRGIVAAPPGHVLTEWDFKSCHVLTLGFLAEDANYIRCARIDMHSLMTGHYLKLWDIKKILAESDAELVARCKWLKSNPEYKHVRDAKVKHAGLGIGNGLKEKGLYERYMEYFASQREARDILRDYEQVFDKVFAWQKAIQQQAHRDQVLRTQFGHIRRFYEVFRWDAKKNGWGHGDQAEEAIAYWLANIAFGHIREKLKELHRAGLDEKYRLFNNVHDSFMFEVREDMLEEHCREVYPVLVAPSKVLKHPTICPDGLVIEVDGAWGRNWSEMQEMDIKALRANLREVVSA